MIDPETDPVVCDRCRRDVPGPAQEHAEAAGWLVDTSVEPHKHFCPAGKSRAG